MEKNLSRKNLIGYIGAGFLTFMLPLGIKVYANEAVYEPKLVEQVESENVDSVPLESWLAYYYPNKTLSGEPVATKIIEPIGELKSFLRIMVKVRRSRGLRVISFPSVIHRPRDFLLGSTFYDPRPMMVFAFM